jgi:glycosidase
MDALAALRDRLHELEDAERPPRYRIPALWLQPAGEGEAPAFGEAVAAGDRVVEVDPVRFFRDCVDAMLDGPDLTPAPRSSAGEWSREAVAYNMFVRQTAAWDHDGDGRIELADLPGGFRETGTFLKAIALLPYLRALGITAIHLLPVTAIGQDGNKGSLGSPYAIRNPFRLDERLGEPWLGVDVDLQYAAFVEAAHRMGMRVIAEFVFRTAAKDSDWIPEHPNWFYWIDAELPDRDPSRGVEGYGNPRFSADELRIIAARVRRNDTAGLPPPPLLYRQQFSEPPAEPRLEDGRYIGATEEGRRLRIPGAFADWPPDDVQPPWNDVTYLKLYDHPSFNYIAYNTIRMYDARLAEVERENRGLWNTIINIIPHHQRSFGIDGVMIDMGHALPRRLKQPIVDRARNVNPDFAFWEENFAISARSRQEGYNAAVGYLWSDEHLPWKLREFCAMLAAQDTPVPFFATAENHNTPRAASRPGGALYARKAFAVNAFLPGILYLHQGAELGETFPVNTGLGFSAEEIAALPSHTLPLFSQSALCWDNPAAFPGDVARITALRRQWELLVTDPRRDTFRLLSSTDERALAFARCSADLRYAILVVANTDCTNATSADISIPFDVISCQDELTGEEFPAHGERLSVRLRPGQVAFFPMSEAPL